MKNNVRNRQFFSFVLLRSSLPKWKKKKGWVKQSITCEKVKDCVPIGLDTFDYVETGIDYVYKDWYRLRI